MLNIIENKICKTCAVEQPISQFYIERRNIGGYRHQCKNCEKIRHSSRKRQYNEKSYQKNKSKRIQEIKDKTTVLKTIVFEYMKNKSCVDCGNNNSIFFEFDHVRGKKIKDINEMCNKGTNQNTLIAELHKCDIVCANCHRTRTDRRAGSYRIWDLNNEREMENIWNSKSDPKRTKMKKQIKILHLFDTGCVDCGTKEKTVLEFDHVRGEKTANISRLLSNNAPWLKINEEIKKCDIVCRNCHLLRTRSRESFITYRETEY